MACGRGISGTYGYDDLNRRQDIKLKTATKRFWGDRFVIQAHQLAHESVNKFAGNHLIFVGSRLDYTVVAKDLATNRRLEPRVSIFKHHHLIHIQLASSLCPH